ncbi:MAG: TIGR00730 family Rossman fold protein [Bacteroidales bacterium]|nr:TIGR00730 family Rossman fold protein [Bacteroidales bacterium]
MSLVDKIKRSINFRKWTDMKANDSWSVFKIMSEFVNGYETLGRIGPCVAIFGSARVTEDNIYYQKAVETASKLVERGFGIITGGGPGIMEAGNKGAHMAGGKSVGLNIVLPHEQHSNPYIDQDKSINFDYFYIRKTMFTRYAQGFIAFPGGFGTLDELSEALTLMQTNKIANFPIVMFGSEFWNPLVDWFRNTLLPNKMIKELDFGIFHVVDDVDEAVEIIDEFYKHSELKPNF